MHALAGALREEYKAIIEAGFVLQLDDPGLPDTWDMANPKPSVAEYKKFSMPRGDTSLKRSAVLFASAATWRESIGFGARPKTQSTRFARHQSDTSGAA